MACSFSVVFTIKATALDFEANSQNPKLAPGRSPFGTSTQATISSHESLSPATGG